jgi:hypothetical protein
MEYSLYERLVKKASIATHIFSIIGILLVITVIAFALPELTPKTSQELYEEDRVKLHKAILVYITGYSPMKTHTENVSMPGEVANTQLDVYPTKAKTMSGNIHAIMEKDVSNDPISMNPEQSVPGGAKRQSWMPKWEDVDGDGKRIIENDILYYHSAYPDPVVDHWNTSKVTFKKVDYVVDSRVWFIDIDLLLEKNYLEEIPISASRDNSDTGNGSYSWFVDEDFTVKSLLHKYPVSGNIGFQGIYP